MKKLLYLVACMLLLTGCVGGEEPAQTNEPGSPPIEQKRGIGDTQIVEGVEFSEMKLEKVDGSTILTMNVKNTTNEAINLSILGYEFFNEEDVFVFGSQVVGQELAAGETWIYTDKIEFDLSYVVSVKFEVNLLPLDQ